MYSFIEMYLKCHQQNESHFAAASMCYWKRQTPIDNNFPVIDINYKLNQPTEEKH